MTNSVGSVLSALVSTVLIIIMTPVFLIYFLLDGHKFLPMLERTILKRDKLNISGLITNLNATISRYISGVSIDAFIIGCLAFIGYSVIGLKYALVFAIFSGLANLIPYVGPSIGLIPMIIQSVYGSSKDDNSSYLYADYPTSRWEYPIPSYCWWSHEGSSDYNSRPIIVVK